MFYIRMEIGATKARVKFCELQSSRLKRVNHNVTKLIISQMVAAHAIKRG